MSPYSAGRLTPSFVLMRRVWLRTDPAIQAAMSSLSRIRAVLVSSPCSFFLQRSWTEPVSWVRFADRASYETS